MKRLVVNADDLGLNPSIDDGIFRAAAEGIVTSATLLVTGPTAPQAVLRARSVGLPLGVHLCLSTGLRCAADPQRVSSVAPGGRFRSSWAEVAGAFALGKLRVDEVRDEFEAQLAKARTLGFTPDHLDAHQHLHLLPGVAEVVDALAAERSLWVRWPGERPQLAWALRPAQAAKSLLLAGLARTAPPGRARRLRAWGVFEAGRLTEDRLCALLLRLPEGDHELGCHPGLGTVQVAEDPAWRYGWLEELNALCSPRVRAQLDELRIRLVSYRELAGATG